ncbi:MAG: hypothetical protein J6R47_00380 [Acholeplasmatales bacterium]|nr:hypothetical protein [Acholeplasmatales bacterium]
MSLLIGLRNSTEQTVPIGGSVDFGAVYRRYDKKGCKCGLRAFESTCRSITLQQSGIYHVTIVATISAPVAGDVILQATDNESPIIGITATETITVPETEFRNITLDFFVLVDDDSILNSYAVAAESISLVNVGTIEVTVSNIVVNVVKEV